MQTGRPLKDDLALLADPTIRVLNVVVENGRLTNQDASTSQMGRFETEAMTSAKNLSALADLSGRWIDRARSHRPGKMLVLDIDSSVSPTHGEQEGTAYNGHFGCTCYHPLFVFNQPGDLERCALRPATCTARTAGVTCSTRWWRGIAVGRFSACCAAMRPLRCPTCTSTWRPRVQVRDLPARQPGAPESDRLPAHAPGGPVAGPPATALPSRNLPGLTPPPEGLPGDARTLGNLRS